jgi:hypothetical protein
MAIPAKAPSTWNPGRAYVWREDRHAVLIRRDLLTRTGSWMCSVPECTVDDLAAAERYLQERGAPERCPAPWGSADPAPALR